MATGTNYPASKDSWSNLELGDDYTAALINAQTSAIEALERAIDKIYKPSRTTRTSTTTLADDPDLVLAVDANQAYMFSFLIFYGALVGNPLKIALGVPSGTTGFWQMRNNNSGTADFEALDAFGDANTMTGNSTGLASGLVIDGSILTSGTAGNLAFRWAQNVSDAIGHYVEIGSIASMQKIP